MGSVWETNKLSENDGGKIVSGRIFTIQFMRTCTYRKYVQKSLGIGPGKGGHVESRCVTSITTYSIYGKMSCSFNVTWR